ncbi:hypothetical protein KI387_008071, partial [Taxus chinensis]
REENKAYRNIKRLLHNLVMESATEQNAHVSYLPPNANIPTVDIGILHKSEDDGIHMKDKPAGKKNSKVIKIAEREDAGMIAEWPGGVAATAKATQNQENTTIREILE